MGTREQFKNVIKIWKKCGQKYRSCSVDHVAQMCSGAVRLEQWECRPAGKRGRSCFSTVQDNRAKCECALRKQQRRVFGMQVEGYAYSLLKCFFPALGHVDLASVSQPFAVCHHIVWGPFLSLLKSSAEVGELLTTERWRPHNPPSFLINGVILLIDMSVVICCQKSISSLVVNTRLLASNSCKHMY